MRPIVLFLLLVISSGLIQAQTNRVSPLTLRQDDRILILAPHPDDEVLGCGGLIQRSVALNLPVQVVYLTYGDNNQWSFTVYRKHAVVLPSAMKAMGEVRHDEAVAAALSLGLHTNQLTFLGYPDFGTLRIWIAHWGRAKPYEGMLTRTTHVPYPDALRPGAPYLGQEIVRDLTTVFRQFKPTKIFVSHPADFNVDHRALYCFTRLTLWTLEPDLHPEVFPYLVHFPDWPKPRGDHPALPLQPPTFFADDIAWHPFPLSPAEVAGNERALQLHHSQYDYSRRYMTSFLKTNALFGDFPDLVFSRPSLQTPVHPSAPESGITFATNRAPHYTGGEDDQLTESERNGFVGVEWRHLHLGTHSVRVSIALSRPLAETVTASIHVFGYRRDTPFESMPKIGVTVGALLHAVQDQDTPLPRNRVHVVRHARTIEAEIPLELLGHPERLFVSARTYLGDIPLDWVSWRVVELR